MYCVAREQKTTYCVIYCNTTLEVAKGFNKQNENGFTDEMLEDYAKRMEVPQLKSTR
jgi:tRNA uridine 5-carbamoylmethylation protein Kti12